MSAILMFKNNQVRLTVSMPPEKTTFNMTLFLDPEILRGGKLYALDRSSVSFLLNYKEQEIQGPIIFNREDAILIDPLRMWLFFPVKQFNDLDRPVDAFIRFMFTTEDWDEFFEYTQKCFDVMEIFAR